jgi:hypothetical protein
MYAISPAPCVFGKERSTAILNMFATVCSVREHAYTRNLRFAWTVGMCLQSALGLHHPAAVLSVENPISVHRSSSSPEWRFSSLLVDKRWPSPFCFAPIGPMVRREL